MRYSKKLIKKLIVMVILSVTLIGNVASASAADPYLTGSKFNKSSLYYYVELTPSRPDVPEVFNIITLDSSISSAFLSWNSKMIVEGINLSFTETTNKSSADIIIEMGTITGIYGLVTHTYINSTTYETSTITLNDYLIYTHWTGGILSPGQMTDIVTHEIGHAIGLADISPGYAETNNITSLMVNSIDSSYFSSYPTSFDITNIEKMY